MAETTIETRMIVTTMVETMVMVIKAAYMTIEAYMNALVMTT